MVSPVVGTPLGTRRLFLYKKTGGLAGVPPAGGGAGAARKLCVPTIDAHQRPSRAAPPPHVPHHAPAPPRASISRSACGCTTSTGATPARRRCCWSTAAATIAATGTGWPRSCAATGTSSPPTCAATATASGRGPAPTRWPATSMTWPSSSISSARPGHHRRPLARRQHRAALCRPLPRERRQAGRHRGAGPIARKMSRAAREELPRPHAHLDRGAARPLGTPAAPLCHHRGRLQAHAGGEQAPDARAGAPPHRRTASTRTRTAPTAGSSTTTCAPGRPTT